MGAALRLVNGRSVGLGLPCGECKTYYPANLERCPVCENPKGGMMSTTSVTPVVKLSLVAKLEGMGAKVKAGILKAMSEVDGVVLPEAETLEPLLAAVMNAVVPGSGNVAAVAESALVALAKILDAGGAAAESNLANAGMDTSLIADVKGLIPSLKAAASAA